MIDLLLEACERRGGCDRPGKRGRSGDIRQPRGRGAVRSLGVVRDDLCGGDRAAWAVLQRAQGHGWGRSWAKAADGYLAIAVAAAARARVGDSARRMNTHRTGVLMTGSWRSPMRGDGLYIDASTWTQKTGEAGPRQDVECPASLAARAGVPPRVFARMGLRGPRFAAAARTFSKPAPHAFLSLFVWRAPLVLYHTILGRVRKGPKIESPSSAERVTVSS